MNKKFDEIQKEIGDLKKQVNLTAQQTGTKLKQFEK